MQSDIPATTLIYIAEHYGTPVYVYFADKITQQYKKLQTAFSQHDVRIFYACKALTNVHILSHIRLLGAGIDCSSIYEVKLALLAGFAPQNILYTSNSISFSEIQEAQSLGVHINIDSLSNLEKFGQAYGDTYPVGIRLRPDIMAGGNLKIATGHDQSKFGIPVDQLNQIIKMMGKYHLNVHALHIHTGSDIKDAGTFTKGIAILLDLISHFSALKIIDLGGGFKVPYEKNDTETDMASLSQKIGETLAAHPNIRNRPLQLWFEPGKFLVSECGYFITQVNVLKETQNITFAGINSGFNHLIRPMFYDAYHHIENISNPFGKEKMYAIVGNICETDTFAWNRTFNEIREGDLLVFHNAGAYGFEMSSNFNSRPKPAEVMVVKDEIKLIRKRETLDDLLKNIIF